MVGWVAEVVVSSWIQIDVFDSTASSIADCVEHTLLRWLFLVNIHAGRYGGAPPISELPCYDRDDDTVFSYSFVDIRRFDEGRCDGSRETAKSASTMLLFI
jgi:hypothetical protein